jgi:N utilization substance protein B
MLFQQDLSGSSFKETKELFWKVRKVSPSDRKFANLIFSQAHKHREEISEMIQSAARKWRIDRMPSVDRNLLKMALAEFFYCETPRAIVIDEAIEIAKEYSGEKSAEFINGVLDAITGE